MWFLWAIVHGLKDLLYQYHDEDTVSVSEGIGSDEKKN